MTKPPMTRRAPVMPGPGHNGPPPDDDDFDIFADRLDGVRAIARFWFGGDDAQSIKKTYRLIELKVIPTGKLGFHHVASKRALRAAYRQMTQGPPKTRDAAE